MKNDSILTGDVKPGKPRAAVSPRVLFMGTPGAFSLPALAALVEASIPVVGVLVPAPRPLLPGTPPVLPIRPVAMAPGLSLVAPTGEQSIVSLAWERGIPVYQVGRLGDPAVLQLAAALGPATICVACFPAILPPALLAIPPAGALNVHPSLLPAYRGPAPVFWIFRHGERRTGVTVHLVDAGIDTGDIVAQEAFDLPDGITGSAVSRRCAEIGGRLMVTALLARAAGRLSGRPQDERDAPPGRLYFSWPTGADFELPTTQPARWAFNFIRGADEWARPFEVVIGDERISIRAALDWSPGGRLGSPYLLEGDEILVQFSPGVLRAVRASTP